MLTTERLEKTICELGYLISWLWKENQRLERELERMKGPS